MNWTENFLANTDRTANKQVEGSCRKGMGSGLLLPNYLSKLVIRIQ